MDKYIEDFVLFISGNENTSNGLIELFIINYLNDIPVIVYDDNDLELYYLDKHKLYMGDKIKSVNKYLENTIKLKFSFTLENNIPDKIYVIYNK